MLPVPEPLDCPLLDPSGLALPTLWFNHQGTLVDVNAAGRDLASLPSALAVIARIATGPAGQLVPIAVDAQRYVATVTLSSGLLAVVLAPQPDAALFDALTGLHSRAGLEAAMLSRGNSYAVYCIDLDRFKFVNDSLGHPIGDALLRMVGMRLRKLAGATGISGRIGGDEFVMVQSLEGPVLVKLAERMVDLLSRTYIIDGKSVNVGASVGVAMANAGSPIQDAIADADLALYEAKRQGRSCHRFYEPTMKLAVARRRETEVALRSALALDEFRLEYQPQVDLRSGAVIGFEALLRWTRADGSAVSPSIFIPVAEEMGLMSSIGDWVLRNAVQEAASWPEHLSVSVNVSPVQFKDPKLAEKVVSAIAHAGLAPARLDLEITEGALLAHTEDVLATLRFVKSMGVTVSMDDFGTGYSSLSYLQKFPFDKVKIDQSFIRGEGGGSKPLIRAIAAIGASLGISTVAEGVETIEQLTIAEAEGVNSVQGYLTGRPMPPDTIATFLAAQGQSTWTTRCTG